MSDELEVTATWRGGYSAGVSARGHRVKVDEPLESGGSNTGFMPTELLCAAMASCFCLAVAHVAAKRSLELPGLTVRVRAERAGRELRYGRLIVEVDAALEAEQLDGLIARAKPLCWVSNMLRDGVAVEYLSTKIDGHPPS